MTNRDRLRQEARKQRMQEESIIDHLVRNFTGGRVKAAEADTLPDRPRSDAGFIYGQVARRWSDGGLPTF
jgi:hypothetical protein